MSWEESLDAWSERWFIWPMGSVGAAVLGKVFIPETEWVLMLFAALVLARSIILAAVLTINSRLSVDDEDDDE